MRPSSPSAWLAWLHLSDLHLRKDLGWEQDIVLASLLKDIEARYGSANRPQVLFVTGDIAFSGKDEEYIPAEDFLRKLCAKVSIPSERVFIVPGNHDIDRTLAEDAFDGARAKLKTPFEVDRFFRSEDRRRAVFVRERAFRAFANRVMKPPAMYDDSSFVHAREIRIGPIRIRVLLLDSSWLATGGERDLGSIVVGERQVIECCQQGNSDGRSFTFALMHHPFSWIADFEQASVENRVIESADVCLRGHLHAEDLRATEEARRRLTVFAAGATFQTRTSENCYLWCSLDLATGRGRRVSHRYNGVKNRWDASEPFEWFLTERAPAPLPCAVAADLVRDHNPAFPEFLKCLLSGLYAEVPTKLPTGEVTFAGIDTILPGSANELGDTVNRLRRHFAIAEIWDAASWKRELQRLIEAWDGAVRAFSGPALTELLRREDRGKGLFSAVSPSSQAGPNLTFANAIHALLGSGDVDGARRVLDHWHDQDELGPLEQLELLRLEVQVFLGEGNPASAMKKAEQLTGDPQRTPIDVALSARCALDLGDASSAGRLMHQAIDSGAPIEAVRTLALKIASLTGDRTLTKKVMA
jgi:UDP-2,3-diacylglucosamine pyrophosphatase LpxH